MSIKDPIRIDVEEFEERIGEDPGPKWAEFAQWSAIGAILIVVANALMSSYIGSEILEGECPPWEGVGRSPYR